MGRTGHDPLRDRDPTIYPREKWKAEPPREPIEDMKTPVNHVLFTFASVAEECHTTEECCRAVLQVQKFHMDHGAPDIPYSFLVGGDKKMYEGRGWNKTVPPPSDKPELAGNCLVFALIGPLRQQEEMTDDSYMYYLINYAFDNYYINQLNHKQYYYPVDWNQYGDTKRLW